MSTQPNREVIDNLVKRLRSMKDTGLITVPHGDAIIDNDGILVGSKPLMEATNPDGAEAATIILQLLSMVEELRKSQKLPPLEVGSQYETLAKDIVTITKIFDHPFGPPLHAASNEKVYDADGYPYTDKACSSIDQFSDDRIIGRAPLVESPDTEKTVADITRESIQGCGTKTVSYLSFAGSDIPSFEVGKSYHTTSGKLVQIVGLQTLFTPGVAQRWEALIGDDSNLYTHDGHGIAFSPEGTKRSAPPEPLSFEYGATPPQSVKLEVGKIYLTVTNRVVTIMSELHFHDGSEHLPPMFHGSDGNTYSQAGDVIQPSIQTSSTIRLDDPIVSEYTPHQSVLDDIAKTMSHRQDSAVNDPLDSKIKLIVGKNYRTAKGKTVSIHSVESANSGSLPPYSDDEPLIFYGLDGLKYNKDGSVFQVSDPIVEEIEVALNPESVGLKLEVGKTYKDFYDRETKIVDIIRTDDPDYQLGFRFKGHSGISYFDNGRQSHIPNVGSSYDLSSEVSVPVSQKPEEETEAVTENGDLLYHMAEVKELARRSGFDAVITIS